MFNSEAMRMRLIYLLCFLLPAVVARAEYFTITRYHVSVTFTEEGYADFEEVIDVEFTEPRHGILRVIPMESVVSGKNITRIIRDAGVDGFKFSSYEEGNNMMIKIGDADIFVEGNQTYRLHYRVLNPNNFFEEHAEFYWDLLGSSWPVVVNQFTFSINFPSRISLSANDVRCFTGPKGSTQQNAELSTSGHIVEGSNTQKMMPEEAFTIAVKLPKQAFAEMSGWNYFREVHGLLLAPFYFIIAGIMGLFFARNQRQPVMTAYFPPEGISPAIAGGFVDHSVDSNDVLCLIPYLAEKGYLRLEMTSGSGFLAKTHVTFFKLKEAGGDLMQFERDFFDALFASGDQVELSWLKNKFYVHLNAVRSAVSAWIRHQGWYEPDQRIMAIVAALSGVGAIIWGIYSIIAKHNLDGIALIVTGIIMFVFAGRFNKRTPAGNEVYQKIEGFRQFVKKAEKPVIERLLQEDPHYYDKTMPFALAFGYLDKWNKQFEGLLSQPPSWYSGTGMHRQSGMQSWNSFAASFPKEVDSIGSVFSSAPSSSGSSSSGGGGSSGGGSGGGGGGSW